MRWAPPVVLVVLIIATYAQFLGDGVHGSDTWAHLWTSRDVGAVLSAPIMTGTSFPERIGRFFRPLSSMSYTVEYAMAGLNPGVMHGLDLLIHVGASLALYGLGRTVGVRPWPAAIGV